GHRLVNGGDGCIDSNRKVFIPFDGSFHRFLRQGAQKLFCFITRGLLGCTDCLLEETDLFDFGFCRLSLKLLFVIRHLYHPCFHFHQYRAHWTVRIMRWCCLIHLQEWIPDLPSGLPWSGGREAYCGFPSAS